MNEKKPEIFVCDNLRISTNGIILGFNEKKSFPVPLIIKESYINPSTNEKILVTDIGDNAFYGEQLTELNIPNTIVRIGDNSFGNSLINEEE